MLWQYYILKMHVLVVGYASLLTCKKISREKEGSKSADSKMPTETTISCVWLSCALNTIVLERKKGKLRAIYWEVIKQNK